MHSFQRNIKDKFQVLDSWHQQLRSHVGYFVYLLLYYRIVNQLPTCSLIESTSRLLARKMPQVIIIWTALIIVMKWLVSIPNGTRWGTDWFELVIIDYGHCFLHLHPVNNANNFKDILIWRPLCRIWFIWRYNYLDSLLQFALVRGNKRMKIVFTLIW